MTISIYLGTKLIKNQELISWSQAQEDMTIYSPHLQNTTTLIFYDVDAPYPYPKNRYSPFLHYLEVNIENGNFSQGQTLIDYAPPNPPKDSPPHRYIVELYEQTNYVQESRIIDRKKFNLEQFVTINNLVLLARGQFSVRPRSQDLKISSSQVLKWTKGKI